MFADRRDLLRRAAYHRSAGLSWDAAAARFPSPVVTGAELEEMAQAFPDDYNSFFRTFQKRRIWELQDQALNALAGLLESKNPRVVLRAADIIGAHQRRTHVPRGRRAASAGRGPRPTRAA